MMHSFNLLICHEGSHSLKHVVLFETRWDEHIRCPWRFKEVLSLQNQLSLYDFVFYFFYSVFINSSDFIVIKLKYFSTFYCCQISATIVPKNGRLCVSCSAFLTFQVLDFLMLYFFSCKYISQVSLVIGCTLKVCVDSELRFQTIGPSSLPHSTTLYWFSAVSKLSCSCNRVSAYLVGCMDFKSIHVFAAYLGICSTSIDAWKSKYVMGLAIMLAAKRLVGVASDMNLRNPLCTDNEACKQRKGDPTLLWNLRHPGQTSPEVQNRGIKWPHS